MATSTRLPDVVPSAPLGVKKSWTFVLDDAGLKSRTSDCHCELTPAACATAGRSRSFAGAGTARGWADSITPTCTATRTSFNVAPSLLVMCAYDTDVPVSRAAVLTVSMRSTPPGGIVPDGGEMRSHG